jgi:hypothetical protein
MAAANSSLLILATVVLAILAPASHLGAEERASAWTVYVNNKTGSDELDGRTEQPSADGKSGPVATIAQALRLVPVSGRVSLANTGDDYRESIIVKGYGKGRAKAPLVIDGNGATVTGLRRATPERWELVRDDVYAFANRVGGAGHAPRDTVFMGPEMRIGDSVYGHMPNFNWMSQWRGRGWPSERQAPGIFFLNGKPGRNASALADLPPGGFFYDHSAKPRRLYFRLPSGAKIGDCAIDLPLNEGVNVLVNDDYVVVRNLAATYSLDDGFAGFWGIGVVFENCNGSYNCDQGMSLHGTSVTIIDGGIYERNGGCGIADVMSSFTIYRNAVIRDNLIGGALLQGLGHSLMNCRIYGNFSPQVSADGDGLVSITNCFVAGSLSAGAGAHVGVGTVDPDGGVGIQVLRGRIDHCTIVNCAQGVVAMEKVSIGNSIIANCAKALVDIRPVAAASFQMSRTILHRGPVVLVGQGVGQDGWPEFAKTVTWAEGNLWADPQVKAPDYALPEDSPYGKFGAYGRACGAVLPPCPAGWGMEDKAAYMRPPP